MLTNTLFTHPNYVKEHEDFLWTAKGNYWNKKRVYLLQKFYFSVRGFAWYAFLYLLKYHLRCLFDNINLMRNFFFSRRSFLFICTSKIFQRENNNFKGNILIIFCYIQDMRQNKFSSTVKFIKSNNLITFIEVYQ